MSSDTASSITPWAIPVRKMRLGDPSNAAAYWRTQSPQARLAALEQIRREYHSWKYGAEPRLQRVCTVVKR